MSNLKNNIPAIITIDPWLQPVTNDVIARYERFIQRLTDIETNHKGISKFSSAYQYFGIHFNADENCWIYREWAPEAHSLYLTGDFNDWNQTSHPLLRIDNGVWEIKLDYSTYKDSFIHESKVKVLVNSQIGSNLRIPAYIYRVLQDDDTKNYSGQLWFPEKFDWKKDSFDPASIGQLLIYEVHVGMAQEEEGIGSYKDFTKKVLPRIKKAGYTAIQMMAIQEHPYYGSFGYHVANFYAASSRFGTPEDLKELIRTAHKMGLAVIMDIVHSHTVKNLNEGLNLFDGSEHQYFHPGQRGEHPNWDSKLFDYGKPEVIQFLLSNVKFWLEEFHFDGFRFDGVGSMMYYHHGDEPIDNIHKFFTDGVEWDAVTYLQLANYLVHKIKPSAITIAEDVTGMPGLSMSLSDGGLGFNYRLGMGIPDFWIKYLKDLPDEEWSIREMWQVLNDRLPYVSTVAYCESHDQALVGDKTIAFRLMDKEMYFHMQVDDTNPVIDRGISLHKLIRLFTISLGGQSYLNFMGNEFGHPEWIDFPRVGNDWSYKHARRQWSLLDDPMLKYQFLAAFDKEMIELVKKQELLTSSLYANELNIDDENKCIIYERGNLIFIFNFHVDRSIPDYEFFVPKKGKYKVILNSDNKAFGGHGRIDESIQYQTMPEQHGKSNRLRIYLTNRTAIVLEQIKH
ncbi:MAG: alpha amylase C-terminal domain-containing protein [Bacteroidales bacterium]|nr:alpha amylase C-terminal domain-containing protein [Bacteroidales bacterium]